MNEGENILVATKQEVEAIIERLRKKESRDNRKLLDSAADMLERYLYDYEV